MITFCNCISLIWFDQLFSDCYIRCSDLVFSESLRSIFWDCRDLFNNRANSSNLVDFFRSIRSTDWNVFRWNLQNLIVWKFTDRNQRCLIMYTEWDDKCWFISTMMIRSKSVYCMNVVYWLNWVRDFIAIWCVIYIDAWITWLTLI
jgi:hypothetical protein